MNKEKLVLFYQQGWECEWAGKLDKNYYPRTKTYENRMLDTLSFIYEKEDSTFTVLDVGCGIGIYSFALLSRFKNAHVVGIDLSQKQIDFISEQAKRFSFKDRGTFLQADAENFSLKSKFDYIICTELLEHLPDPRKALKNILLHGHKRTKFIFSVPHIYGAGASGWFFRQYRKDNDWIETQKKEDIDFSKPYYEFYHHEYVLEEAKKLLEESGFVVEKAVFCNFNFKNRYITYAYSQISTRSIDMLFNRLTNNKRASQITLLCSSEKPVNS